MKFKEEKLLAQFNSLPPKLQEIAIFFDDLSAQKGIESVVTRILDPVAHDSGVHEANRAIDFRDEHEGKRLYSDQDVMNITATINQYYPRSDGKLVCIHHSFEGGEYHFHIQIPFDWINDHASMAVAA